MSCTNVTLISLGTLRGVFGAEIDRINGEVLVNHTDEVSREEISSMLESLGYNEIIKDQEIETDEPSIWGCAL
ncbi:MAG: hypothetical protein WCK78_06660 [Paludibacter sp.]